MAQFSDNEEFEVDSILQERKRKGVLEYLVKWKGSGDGSETWEPAQVITEDCSQAVKKFLTSQKKAKTKRSTSRSRKVSRSRSRSSSRSRKAASSKAGKSPSRSSSRGRAKKAVAEAKVEKKTEIVEDNTRSTRTSRRTGTLIVESSSETEVKTATKSVPTLSKTETSDLQKEPQGRVLRSTTMDAGARQRLEVQRVHNEQRPVHENDNKPRSAIWKIADYAVIVLFILSLLAALFLFLEKFLDLEEFKKQALPNMGVLKRRLEGAQQRLVDLGHVGMEKATDVWLYLVEQIKGAEPVKTAKDTVAPGA